MLLKRIFGCRLLINIALVTYEIFSIFMTDVIMYEITGGVKFKWKSLIYSKLFWIWVIVVIVYNLFIIKEKRKEGLDKAYEDTEIALLKLITKDAKNHDFYSVDETVKIIEKVKKIKDKKDG